MFCPTHQHNYVRACHYCALETKRRKKQAAHFTDPRPTHSLSDLAIVNDELKDYATLDLLYVAMLRLKCAPESSLADMLNKARCALAPRGGRLTRW